MTGVVSWVVHLRDEHARFAPLVAAIFRALELGDGGVDLERELVAPATHRWDAGRGIRATLGRWTGAPDPYAGGPIDVRELHLEREGGHARLAVEEIAWVGYELRVHARGMGEDGETIERVARDWLASLG